MKVLVTALMAAALAVGIRCVHSLSSVIGNHLQDGQSLILNIRAAPTGLLLSVSNRSTADGLRADGTRCEEHSKYIVFHFTVHKMISY